MHARPPTKLNTRNLTALKPNAASYRVWDSEIKGYYVRVSITGLKTLRFFYRIHGQSKDISLGRFGQLSAEAARRYAKEVAGQVSMGIDVDEVRKTEKQKALNAKFETLDNFVRERYQPWAEANITKAKENVRVLRKDFRFLLNRQMSQITPWDVHKWSSSPLSTRVKEPGGMAHRRE